MTEYIVDFADSLVNLENEYINECVVRCRDCKHLELLNVSYSDNPLFVCLSEQWIGAEGDNPLVKADSFCAWGERK